MLKLIIEDDEGRKTVVPFVREEITIGRQEGNTIRLTERNVSRRHARLLRQNGAVVVEDLGSYNGIRINGERIQGQVAVHDGDLIQIGDYDLAIQHDAAQVAPPPAPLAHDPDLETTAPSGDKEKRNGAAAAQTYDDSALVARAQEPEPAPEAAPDPKEAEAVRRQSTSVIRVDQIESRQRKVVDLDPEEAPRLVVLNTELAGREFSCIRTELRIGRADDNDIAIDHRSLSRTHAKVVREDHGEWRVIDMQSANGLSVNGERYAQVTLRGGDVLELGHVKLRFVGPGEEAPAEDSEVRPKKRGSRAPLLVAVLLVVAAGGGLALYAMNKQAPRPLDPKQLTRTEPEERETPAAKTPEPPPVNEAPVAQRLEAARLAVETREWDRAADILGSCKLPDGSLHPEAKALLTQLKDEDELKRNIDRAEKLIDSGKLEKAKRLLDESEHTRLLSKAHAELRARLDGLAQERLAAKPTVKKPPEPSPALEARKAYDEGFQLFKNKQLREARAALERCLKIDASFPDCHKALGGVYARLGEPDKGAFHYKKFLQLAPDDEDADKVRQIIEQYEQSKQR